MSNTNIDSVKSEIEIEKSLLFDFDNSKEEREYFAKTIYGLIKQLLNNLNLTIHSVSFRCKERDSFNKKIRRPDKHYTELNEITDLVGIRITTYFENDVDIIKEMLNEEFIIDNKNTIDKRLHDPDRFGYMSVHYILELSEKRCNLNEYKNFKNMKCEVQIRSVLQHTWAEIEHDLGYKSEITIPDRIRRKFSQLAGLLEIADQQFLSIRNDIEEYSENLPNYIDRKPIEVLIDKISLSKLIEKEYIYKIDKKITKKENIEKNQEFIDSLVLKYKYFEYSNVHQIIEDFNKYNKYILPFHEEWSKNKKRLHYDNGISLMYILYIAVAKTNNDTDIINFSREFNPKKGVVPDSFAERIRKTISIIGL